MLNIEKIFEEHEDDFIRFERVEKKLSNRRDLHAFILLDSILPNSESIISGANHDELWLDIDLEELAKKATKEQIIDLHRCGIRYFSEYDCLGMFV